MSDLDGQTIVITGANTGLGEVAAMQLAVRGARVVLACRSEAKTTPVLEAIRVAAPLSPPPEFVHLDLASLASVRTCVAELKTRTPIIDVLINNAGVAGQRGITADGFELHFGVNHLGHYLWTRLLLEQVTKRLVIVASNSHRNATGIDWDVLQQSTPTVVGIKEYGVSKLCNLLMQRELTRRLGPSAAVHTYSLNPGRVATDAWRRMPGPVRWLAKRFMITSEQGGSFVTTAAADPSVAEHTGRYYNRSIEQTPSEPAQNDELARELWQRSAAWVGLPTD